MEENYAKEMNEKVKQEVFKMATIFVGKFMPPSEQQIQALTLYYLMRINDSLEKLCELKEGK